LCTMVRMHLNVSEGGTVDDIEAESEELDEFDAETTRMVKAEGPNPHDVGTPEFDAEDQRRQQARAPRAAHRAQKGRRRDALLEGLHVRMVALIRAEIDAHIAGGRGATDDDRPLRMAGGAGLRD